MLQPEGFAAASPMQLFYSLEDRSSWFVLAFAGSGVMRSVYGYLQRAWPFGLAVGAWPLVALGRWRIPRKRNGYS